ncbi:hypothetical protein B0H21DRAFT_467103 [Amylocystis lapponica]|nr:hypothetical protein B0H21DRAFT_467103 [Amylocystis lapponica]
MHPADALAQVPPPLLVPRDLQRDDPRPAHAAVLQCLAARADLGHWREHCADAEPEERVAGPRARREELSDSERSSHSHSAFRVVIESRKRGSGASEDAIPSGQMAPGFRPPTPGGPHLQARVGRSVQTSQSVDETKGDESHPGSPAKKDFDMSPYVVSRPCVGDADLLARGGAARAAAAAARRAGQREGPAARRASEDDLRARDRHAGIRGQLGEPLRAVREDVECEWVARRREKEAWADQLVKQLDKEKEVHRAAR